MHTIDWIILLIPIFIVIGIVIYTRKYMKSVADFLSGRRLADRYLLSVARGEMLAGAVVFVWSFEIISQSGFVLTWWQQMSAPVGLLLTIFGFVIYRYRETRAMTLAQFFEIRYSKSFRLFAGVMGFVAGILNFGIIPAVGSRFLVYFFGFPTEITFFSYTVPTYILLMAGLLTLTVVLSLSGGLLTLMIADCVEGIMSQLFYLIILCGLLCMFNWSEISQVLAARPVGHSLLNPFDAVKASDFNFTYVLMTLCTGVYATMAWQNSSAYNSAASTPHESRMGGILGRWREMGKVAVVTLLAVCAMTFLSHPDFSEQSVRAHQLIEQIKEPQIQKQMQIPIAVSEMLPIGIKGLLCAVLIMGVLGGDSTHLHSWGSILIQDVFVPLRKKPMEPRQHIFALRAAIIGVALFAFVFGSLFNQTEYVAMWFQVTTGIFVGGAGSVIIGGLYWKKGTTEGAWAAMATGSLLSFGGIVARQFYGAAFPLNGTQIYFTASLTAISVYILISLLTCKEDFNMDRMLHRGAYAKSDPISAAQPKAESKRGFSWEKLVGIDANFTRGDKCIAAGLLVWTFSWFCLFLIGTMWNIISPWPVSIWQAFWKILGVGVPILFSVVTGIWFTWGGLRDIRSLFRRLKSVAINHRDDGTVVDHQNFDEIAPTAEVRPLTFDKK